jgi:hypothetical protein
MKDALRLNRNLFKLCSRNFLLLTVTLLCMPTCQLLAPMEGQVLHAHGKMPLRKVTCEKEHRATGYDIRERKRKRGNEE